MNCVYMLNFKQSAHSLRQNTSNILHHINGVKLFSKDSAMGSGHKGITPLWLGDILRGWGPDDPPNKLKRDSLHYLSL